MAIKKRHPKTFILQDKKDASQPPVLKRTFHDWFCLSYNAIARRNSIINTIQTRTRRQEPQPSSRNSKIAPIPLNSQPKIPPPVKMISIKTMIPMIANISIFNSLQFASPGNTDAGHNRAVLNCSTQYARRACYHSFAPSSRHCRDRLHRPNPLIVS